LLLLQLLLLLCRLCRLCHRSLLLRLLCLGLVLGLLHKQ